MKIRSIEIEPDEEQPFKNCVFGREKYANTLTSIVETYADGFVLALNNEWGTGKTTFIKMWQQALRNKNINTLYFNVWEHDFDHDATVAVLSELKSLTKPDSKSFNRVLNKAGRLASHMIPVLVRALADKYVNTQGIEEAVEKFSEEAINLLNSEIKDYTQKKESLKAFQIELEKYVKESCGEKPLVFLIDELDRCRPNYAVEVLEKVKHFFSVPGIVFVLAIDKKQLENAIKGVYGSEEINAEEYLRRFIDLEFNLPRPDTESFCKSLMLYFGFNELLSDRENRGNFNQYPNHESFTSIASQLFSRANLTLRQQEKFFAHIRIAILEIGDDYNMLPVAIIILMEFRLLHRNLYEKIKARQLSPQEFLDILPTILPFDKPIKDVDLPREVAILAVLYINAIKRDKPLETNSLQNKKLELLEPKFDQYNTQEFRDAIHDLQRNNHLARISTNSLIDRIELAEDI